MTIRDDVLATTEAMANCISSGEDAVVQHLVGQGYSPVRAEVLVAFVPLALARTVIARLPTSTPFTLPDRAIIQNSLGDQFSVRLLDVPEFATALSLGEETFRTGVIPRDHFASSCYSAEFNLVNQMLNENIDIGGVVFSAPILLRLAETAGFAGWYQSISEARAT